MNIKFEMFFRYLRGEIKWVVGYRSVVFKGEVGVGYMNLGINGMNVRREVFFVILFLFFICMILCFIGKIY